MNNLKRQFELIEDAAEAGALGAFLGAFAGFVLFFFWGMAFYSIFGIFVNTMLGFGVGALNGIALNLMRSSNTEASKRTFVRSTILITLIAGWIGYYCIYYPLTRTLEGTILAIIPPVGLALVIATITARLVGNRQLKQ